MILFVDGVCRRMVWQNRRIVRCLSRIAAPPGGKTNVKYRLFIQCLLPNQTIVINPLFFEFRLTVLVAPAAVPTPRGNGGIKMFLTYIYIDLEV